MKKILRLIKKILCYIQKSITCNHSAKNEIPSKHTTVSIAQINHGKILKNKKILITGGGSGIGFSIAEKCVQEGAEVIITGRNEDKLSQAKSKINNPLLKTLVWDIAQVSHITVNVQRAKELLNGDIDLLVNNAGVNNSIQFPNVTEEIWDKMYATNSKGLFFLTQALCKQWIETENKKTKKVINISSQGAFVGATYPYRMTKWDVAGLTQGLGLKMAPHNIIINGIAPGIVATNMQPNCLKQKENVYYPRNPLERFALPEEIAELAMYLLSDASNFIVGQTIVCDGGYSLK